MYSLHAWIFHYPTTVRSSSSTNRYIARQGLIVETLILPLYPAQVHLGAAHHDPDQCLVISARSLHHGPQALREPRRRVLDALHCKVRRCIDVPGSRSPASYRIAVRTLSWWLRGRSRCGWRWCGWGSCRWCPDLAWRLEGGWRTTRARFPRTQLKCYWWGKGIYPMAYISSFRSKLLESMWFDEKSR